MRQHPRRLVAAIAIAVFIAVPAAADPVADFYKGKQIRVVIRAAPGGNYDRYSRLLIRHMVRYIPGHPDGVPVNMPGGSGLTALNYVTEVHPKDGTVLTMVTQTFPMQQALGLNRKLTADMRALNWIGNMSDANSFLLTSAKSKTRTLDDAKRRETIIAVPSMSDTSAWLVLVTNSTLGTKFKLVPGYTSGPNMNLAMERGEVEGRGTSNPRSLLPGGVNKGPDGRPLFNFILQWGLTKDADYPDVPLLRALAKDADQQSIFDFVSSVASLARPVATSAGVPPERVAALRRAFAATMKDTDFLAEAKKQGMEITPMGGEALQKVVTSIVNAPPGVVAKVKAAVTR
jgi:tripartite-type tricarboxylate transporter receptor subunit TctC